MRSRNTGGSATSGRALKSVLGLVDSSFVLLDSGVRQSDAAVEYRPAGRLHGVMWGVVFIELMIGVALGAAGDSVVLGMGFVGPGVFSWMFLVRPRLLVDADTVVVTNLRTRRFAHADIRAVQTARPLAARTNNLVLDLGAGKRQSVSAVWRSVSIVWPLGRSQAQFETDVRRIAERIGCDFV